MPDTAKLFTTGGSQAVRLPAAYRFDGDEVFIRKNSDGEVVLSSRPATWDGFFEAVGHGDFPADFMDTNDRNQDWPKPDPLAGWQP